METRLDIFFPARLKQGTRGLEVIAPVHFARE